MASEPDAPAVVPIRGRWATAERPGHAQYRDRLLAGLANVHAQGRCRPTDLPGVQVAHQRLRSSATLALEEALTLAWHPAESVAAALLTRIAGTRQPLRIRLGGVSTTHSPPGHGGQGPSGPPNARNLRNPAAGDVLVRAALWHRCVADLTRASLIWTPLLERFFRLGAAPAADDFEAYRYNAAAGVGAAVTGGSPQFVGPHRLRERVERWTHDASAAARAAAWRQAHTHRFGALLGAMAAVAVPDGPILADTFTTDRGAVVPVLRGARQRPHYPAVREAAWVAVVRAWSNGRPWGMQLTRVILDGLLPWHGERKHDARPALSLASVSSADQRLQLLERAAALLPGPSAGPSRGQSARRGRSATHGTPRGARRDARSGGSARRRRRQSYAQLMLAYYDLLPLPAATREVELRLALAPLLQPPPRLAHAPGAGPEQWRLLADLARTGRRAWREGHAVTLAGHPAARQDPVVRAAILRHVSAFHVPDFVASLPDGDVAGALQTLGRLADCAKAPAGTAGEGRADLLEMALGALAEAALERQGVQQRLRPLDLLPLLAHARPELRELGARLSAVVPVGPAGS